MSDEKLTQFRETSSLAGFWEGFKRVEGAASIRRLGKVISLRFPFYASGRTSPDDQQPQAAYLLQIIDDGPAGTNLPPV